MERSTSAQKRRAMCVPLEKLYPLKTVFPSWKLLIPLLDPSWDSFFCQTGRVIEDATQDFCGATSTQSLVSVGLKSFWSHKFILCINNIKKHLLNNLKEFTYIFNQVYRNLNATSESVESIVFFTKIVVGMYEGEKGKEIL